MYIDASISVATIAIAFPVALLFMHNWTNLDNYLQFNLTATPEDTTIRDEWAQMLRHKGRLQEAALAWQQADEIGDRQADRWPGLAANIDHYLSGYAIYYEMGDIKSAENVRDKAVTVWLGKARALNLPMDAIERKIEKLDFEISELVK